MLYSSSSPKCSLFLHFFVLHMIRAADKYKYILICLIIRAGVRSMCQLSDSNHFLVIQCDNSCCDVPVVYSSSRLKSLTSVLLSDIRTRGERGDHFLCFIKTLKRRKSVQLLYWFSIFISIFMQMLHTSQKHFVFTSFNSPLFFPVSLFS